MEQSVESKVQKFDPKRVRPLPGQPRKRFRNIPELAASIKASGQWVPGIVTPVTDDPNFDVELIEGERRLRACTLAEVQFEAVVRSGQKEIASKFGVSETDARFLASFGANFGKSEHDCLEIAYGLKRLQDMGLTHQKMADVCGASTAWISNHLKILEMDPAIQKLLVLEEPVEVKALENGDGEGGATKSLPLSLVPALVSLPPKAQQSVARQIVKKGLTLVAGQRLILDKLHEHGIEVEHKKRIRRMKPITEVLHLMAEKVALYQDLVKNGQFKVVLEKMSSTEKQALVDQINEFNDELSEIADAVENDITPPKARPQLVRKPAATNGHPVQRKSITRLRPGQW